MPGPGVWRVAATTVAAAVFFAVVSAWVFGRGWAPSASAAVPVARRVVHPDEGARVAAVARADTVFVAARLRGHALALLGNGSLLKPNVCAPYSRPLTVADPMLGVGLLGLPGHLLAGGAAGAMNGALVGGASLKADEFLGIAKAIKV